MIFLRCIEVNKTVSFHFFTVTFLHCWFIFSLSAPRFRVFSIANRTKIHHFWAENTSKSPVLDRFQSRKTLEKFSFSHQFDRIQSRNTQSTETLHSLKEMSAKFHQTFHKNFSQELLLAGYLDQLFAEIVLQFLLTPLCIFHFI